MFSSKRRSSHPSDPSSASQQRKSDIPIPSSSSATIISLSSSLATRSSPPTTTTLFQAHMPPPPDLQISTSNSSKETMSDPSEPAERIARPTFEPAWNDASLYKELSSFQFGAPAVPSSSSPPPSPPTVSKSTRPVDYDDDELVSPFTANDVTPRPSVASAAPPNQRHSSIQNHSYGDAPLYKTSSHPSQTSPPHRHRSRSPTQRIPSRPGPVSPSSSASASVSSLTSGSPDEDLNSSRSAVNHDRDIEFSSEEEYEYDEDDGYHEIEVSSAYWEDGHGDRPDSFYYFGGGGSAVGMGSGLIAADTGRRGSVPMAIPGTSDTPVAGSSAVDGPASRDREGSIATLRRPSRSLEDQLRGFSFGAPGRGSNQPGAIPQSDPLTRGEWSAMESRQEQMQRSRGGPLDTTDVATPTLASSSHGASSSTATVAATGDITSLGFDLDWSNLRGGITSLDDSDIAGLVDPKTTIAAARRPSGGLILSSMTTGNTSPGPGSAGAGGRTRMGSWFSMLSGRRQSEATVLDDTFLRNVRHWDYTFGSRRRDWSFRRERGSASGPSGGQERTGERTGTGIGVERTESATSGVFGSSQKVNVAHDRGSGERDRDRDKERERDKRKAPKGMAVGTSEIWSNELVGRFKVDRRAARPLDSSKPPQQRLNFIHFQGASSQVRTLWPGPPVTVHKHSKAIAFSISRQHAKPRPRPRDGPHPAQRVIPRETTAPKSSMIMLAPKRVQEQYTNTTTTRRLDTHGLLEDHVVSIRREKERRELELERRRKAELERQRKETSTSGSTSSTRSDRSVNSLSNARELYPTPPPASAPSLHTYPPTPPNEIRKHASSRSLRSAAVAESSLASTSSTTVVTTRSTSRRVLRDPYDFDDPDEDDLPTRTPHAETYATIDPAQVEQLRQIQSRLDSEPPSRSLLRRLLPFANSNLSGSPLSASIDGSFKAPWMTMAPRAKQEEHERVVANLNESFIDVGLLPSRPVHKAKSTANTQKQKQLKQRQQAGSGSNIFENVPPESLYMLLPLWPGETDPVSEKLPNEPRKPEIPMERRLYLLVYYVADEVNRKDHESKSKVDNDSRGQRKPRSPTSSVDSPRRPDDRSILLSAFHVSARLVGYEELLGSGMRVPEEGLSVTGPMSEALKSIPSRSMRDENQADFMIGMCQSRDAGVEFIQEGLVKMGLCLVVSPAPRNPAILLDETEEMEEPDVVLSPIGRAVVEMAWVGCMALTSFGPTV
ncbi:hypothetical protein CCMSSC00406_0003908 [Pleurotus cornucopiae]|uniref:Uncharacterized protein n=1 Tax=Pleurotus cornucopiae TaxID=5321 RepID=A0ACB7IQB4_PLECO|nr:hypothetical protein CCMSSC00406_0003908 [Pleurotus cornucopiae]